MKLLILLLCLISASVSHGFSRWDRNNNPGLFYEELERKYDQLPKRGQLKSTPWSGDYWPTYKGGLTYRYGYPSRADNVKYGYELNRNFNSFSERELSYLSPAEKYDIYLGRTDYPVTTYERNRTQILKTVEGSEMYQPGYTIPTWEGLCHSWAPATYQYIEPDPVVMTNKDGIKIPFYTSDIKALLTLKGHVLPATNQRFLGSRCYLDFKELEKKLKAGEITREQFLEQINSKSCEDVNAGAFHVILTNRIALKDRSFIIDITRDAEVWNQPIEAYYVKELSRRSGASDEAAPGTVSEVVVQVWVRYVAEVGQHYQRTVSTRDSLKVVQYKYQLELNQDDEIIGGRWLSFERPDFIWDEDVPNFKGFFAPLEDIYNKSIAYAKPSLWEDKIDKIKKLGHSRIHAREFIRKAKVEVTKSKMMKASKKEIIKRQFVIEAAKKALETRIRKAKRQKFLKRKLRRSTMGDVYAKVFLKELKKDAHSTKVKNKWKKLGKKASNFGGAATEISNRPAEIRQLTRQFVEAAKASDLHKMSVLVKKGADPTGKKIGLTPDEILAMVFQNQNAEVIATFLKLGANPTPYLHQTIDFGNNQIFTTLLSFGPAFDKTNDLGETPLLHIARVGNIDLLRSLLTMKLESSDLNKVDLQSRSAIHLTIVGSGSRPDDTRVDMVELLINIGVDVNLEDKNGETALRYVTFGQRFSHYKMRRLLKAAGGKR